MVIPGGMRMPSGGGIRCPPNVSREATIAAFEGLPRTQPALLDQAHEFDGGGISVPEMLTQIMQQVKRDIACLHGFAIDLVNHLKNPRLRRLAESARLLKD